MEKNTSGPVKDRVSQPVCETCAEPYVGMPIYLDDSFFKFIGDDIGVECPVEEDMDEYMDDMMPENGEMIPKNGEMKPENGNGEPEMDEEMPMYSLEDMALAMAYVPWQVWGQTYDLEKGFMVGTIFPDLDLPFRGGAAK